MRILAITSLYPNPLQPHRAAFNRQQFRALACEHEVRVIAPISWTGEWSARRGGNAPPLGDDRTRICDGMMIHHPRFAFTPKVFRGWHGRFLVESIRTCFREAVAEFRPDVVLGCWAYPDGWAAVQLAREANLPVAIKMHGSDLLTLDGQHARTRRTKEALSSAGAVIAVSRHLAARAAKMAKTKGSDPFVVYNGVDTDLFRPLPRDVARRALNALKGINNVSPSPGTPGEGSSDPLILFVGNLVPVKGLDVLIDALAALANSGQRFECKLVGDGPLKEALQRRIKSLGLGSRIELVGPRSLEELPLWYQSANLVVLPSRSEGVPNVLLEASACGIPFVASNVGGIPEIAPADALVPPDDSAALAERIAAFLDPARRVADDGTFRAGSWSDSARALAAVLGGVVAAHRNQTALAG